MHGKRYQLFERQWAAKFHGYHHTRIGNHPSLSSGERLESKYLKKKTIFIFLIIYNNFFFHTSKSVNLSNKYFYIFMYIYIYISPDPDLNELPGMYL